MRTPNQSIEKKFRRFDIYPSKFPHGFLNMPTLMYVGQIDILRFHFNEKKLIFFFNLSNRRTPLRLPWPLILSFHICFINILIKYSHKLLFYSIVQYLFDYKWIWSTSSSFWLYLSSLWYSRNSTCLLCNCSRAPFLSQIRPLWPFVILPNFPLRLLNFIFLGWICLCNPSCELILWYFRWPLSICLISVVREKG